MAKITKAKRLEILAKFPEFQKQITNLKLTIEVMNLEMAETLEKLDDLEENIEEVERKKLELNV